LRVREQQVTEDNRSPGDLEHFFFTGLFSGCSAKALSDTKPITNQHFLPLPRQLPRKIFRHQKSPLKSGHKPFVFYESRRADLNR
jgi:hypothetical protein